MDTGQMLDAGRGRRELDGLHSRRSDPRPHRFQTIGAFRVPRPGDVSREGRMIGYEHLHIPMVADDRSGCVHTIERMLRRTYHGKVSARGRERNRTCDQQATGREDWYCGRDGRKRKPVHGIRTLPMRIFA